MYNSEYKEQKYVYMSNELERERAVMYSTLYMASAEKMKVVNKEKTKTSKNKNKNVNDIGQKYTSLNIKICVCMSNLSRAWVDAQTLEIFST